MSVGRGALLPRTPGGFTGGPLPPPSLFSSPPLPSPRREHVFEDTFHQLRSRTPEEMRLKLNVQFTGEEGIDAGGVSREWYQVGGNARPSSPSPEPLVSSLRALLTPHLPPPPLSPVVVCSLPALLPPTHPPYPPPTLLTRPPPPSPPPCR